MVTAPKPFLADGKTPRCCDIKFRGSYFPTQCGFRGKVVREGKPYCGTHDPVARKLDQDAKDAEWKRIREAREARDKERFAQQAIDAARLALWPDAIQALQDISADAWGGNHGLMNQIGRTADAILARAEKLK